MERVSRVRDLSKVKGKAVCFSDLVIRKCLCVCVCVI